MTNIMLKRNSYISTLLRQFSGFSVIGILVTLFSVGLLFIFTEVLHVNIYISNITVYIISIGVSYLLNGRFIFKRQFCFRTYITYYGIYISGMGLGLLIIALIKNHTDLNDFLNSLCAAPVTMTWNFLFSRRLFLNHSGSIEQ